MMQIPNGKKTVPNKRENESSKVFFLQEKINGKSFSL
jgi:hypothetical protein